MNLPKPLILCALICIITIHLQGQSLLNKTVSITAKNERLSSVLNKISKQGNFFFSYLSTVVPQDSTVNINIKDKPVKQVLEQLLGDDYVFKESGNYIIILRKTVIQNFYVVSGVVTDKHTGAKLPNVSVYERQQLISTITNNEGYFRLRLKDRYPAAAISVSKDLYADTSVMLPAGQDQELELYISPVTYQLKVVDVTGKHTLEKNWFAQVFLSSRQKLTTLNIGGFLADKPYQVSLTPGLGTHGKMSGQVVNKFSFNLIGGYAAGVDGVEVGTLFNMVKNDVKDVQVSGFINVVGGKVHGVQVAGFHNNVGDSVVGVQIAGFSNIINGHLRGVQVTGAAGSIHGDANGVQVNGGASVTRGSVDGVQVAGAFSLAAKNMSGAQVTGGVNLVKRDVSGAQVSGIANIGRQEVHGVQIGLFNFARRLKGVQIGLINIADTTDGFSLGLVSIARKGYKKLSLFSTDMLPFNLAWKSGNRHVYSILTGGVNTGEPTLVSVGYGIGNELNLNHALTLNTELISNTLFQTSSKYTAQQINLRPSLQWKLMNKVSIFAGPALVFHLADNAGTWEYKSSYPNFRIGNSVNCWLGWQAGISFF
jgi:hypothetical protein